MAESIVVLQEQMLRKTRFMADLIAVAEKEGRCMTDREREVFDRTESQFGEIRRRVNIILDNMESQANKKE